MYVQCEVLIASSFIPNLKDHIVQHIFIGLNSIREEGRAQEVIFKHTPNETL